MFAKKSSANNGPKDFLEYREEMAGRFASLRIGEAALAVEDQRTAARPDERLAQCIWFDRLLVHDGLRTDSGKPLEILQPGRWNQEEGPDFRDARVRVDGRELRGDVEVHLNPEGWRQHRHHLNPVYNSVVLHVSLWKSERPQRFKTAEGRPVEGFTMERVLFPDFDTIRQTVRVEDYPYQAPGAVGRCQPLMCSMDADYIGGLLDSAGRERLETKARRFGDQAVGESLPQVLYQAIMTSMGHKSNKGLFFLLSKRAPLSEITDYLRDVLPEAGRRGDGGDDGGAGAGLDAAGRRRAETFFQSLLLHVAQLAPEAGFEPLMAKDSNEAGDGAEADEEIRDYLEGIRGVWRQFSGYFSDRIIPPTKQWTTGVRPVNFAHRRVAGVAHLLARWFLDGDVLEAFARKVRSFDPDSPPRARTRWIRSELVDAFVVEDPEGFWARRYNFTSKRARRPMKLIGESRASSIVFNALLPLLLHYAREKRDTALEDRVRQVFAVYPRLESNSIVRHMRVRLFGGEEARAKAVLTTEARQQGLFQIFSACCNHNETGCEDCYYLKVRQ